MIEGTIFLYNLSALNGIVTEVEVIRVKIEDEDKALRLLFSFNFLQAFVAYLMYGNETMDLEEVISILLLEERRLSCGRNGVSDDSALIVGN